MKWNGFFPLVAGLMLLTGGAVRADTLYKIQPLVELGDRVADVWTNQAGYMLIGRLNDNGQLAFVILDAAGSNALIQYSDGQFTPVVAANGNAPGGK
jgi:hypothetical protein